ncbi:hypothetical protein RQP54_13750 [Curvibacter sp. APW13]|uniref:hypothetical protein n=1 Tax=Curvibacter sp. APW13 TaxID=3077236 RepID=UPI0028DD9781|nr:hypothetical protein [Curvibacter sp. APW13]MDT8991930.1 hypothetical protein [Curvibacter sp. APW13]
MQSASSEPFERLAHRLKAVGFPEQAAQLDAVLQGVWTTSSELLGELGRVLLLIRRECRPRDAETKALLKICANEVRKAWPGFGWCYWWPW